MSLLEKFVVSRSPQRQSRRLKPLEPLNAPMVFRPTARRSGKPAIKPTRANSGLGFPTLPSYVVKYRDQKKCPYCKHFIDEDPYSHNQNYWVNYVLIEIAEAFTEVMNLFTSPQYGRQLKPLQQFMLPGWVRCKNSKCSQLYHANCWHHIKSKPGCLRCHTKKAIRVA